MNHKKLDLTLNFGLASGGEVFPTIITFSDQSKESITLTVAEIDFLSSCSAVSLIEIAQAPKIERRWRERTN
jgi:hypothetical protein